MNFKWPTLLTLLILIGACACSNTLRRRNFVDIEANNAVAPVQNQQLVLEQPQRVPKIQLDAGKAINLTILAASFLSRFDGILAKIPMAFALPVAFHCLQLFFGYKIQIIPGSSHNDNLIDRLPRINFTELNFKNDKEFVYFEQWVFTPLSWFIQILLSLPTDTYQNLYLYYGFPDYTILTGFFVIVLVNMCGIFHP